ncbi:MAG: bifunctional glutamate N-acetyltransferase/amino-acid acetyltransferase ArgJ [Acidimicrobiia bacterium]|nr:bifunctional glutamate N-acetyltransferase/amino-acid acetyltransferase ArgJ [Acidimicrobiia bacterium]
MSVVLPAGFTAAGVSAGIKDRGLDVAVVVSDSGSVASGVFTRNQAAAPPVVMSRRHLDRADEIHGVVINSGCANAATGDQGRANAERMAATLAEAIGCDPTGVLVCSTGTIGPQLPMEHVVPGIDAAAAARSREAVAGTAAAEAITTTDTVTKEAVATMGSWSVGGMAKGAGMVRPDMATMLAIITTDAVVDRQTLDRALNDAVQGSFNSLNIDGCESTNDSVLMLASGASGVEPSPADFAKAVEAVCVDLAMQMARDAEGASRVVTIDVTGAADDDEARYLGKRVADSALVRASFYGGDVNWGRIVGALGAAGRPVDVDSVSVSYQGVVVFDGLQVVYDEAALLEECETGDLEIGIVVGQGPGRAHIVTTDLTPEYVVFNGERS